MYQFALNYIMKIVKPVTVKSVYLANKKSRISKYANKIIIVVYNQKIVYTVKLLTV